MKKLLVAASFIFLFSAIGAVNAQDRKSVSAAEVNGIFRAKGGSEFKILALGKGKLRVAFSGVYFYKMANGEAMANTGEADGTAFIEGDTATFKIEDFGECMITIKFLVGKKIDVSQKGSDCGFGHNVTADGIYKKSNNAKPKFDR